MKAIKRALLHIQRGLVFFLTPTENISVEEADKMLAEIDLKIQELKRK